MPSTMPPTGYVLVNSLPKSGTHLLERALMLLGVTNREATRSLPRRVTDRLGLSAPPFIEHRSARRWSRVHLQGERYGPDAGHSIPVGVFSPIYVPAPVMVSWLRPAVSGAFVKAHLPYDPGLATLFDQTGTRPITILRDPRAVVASMVPYVLDAGNFRHGLKQEFQMRSEEERIDFVIEGGTAQNGQPLLSLAEAFASVLDWSRHPGSLVVRFEDLVGPRGGGSAEALEVTLEAITGHLGIALTPEIRARMDEVFDPNSPTFRGGRVDGWRERLSPGQVARIEAAVGPELFARAGYAVDAG